MKPGRELDALVAEKVMGQKEFMVLESWNKKTGEYSAEIVLANYSSDIAAAWEVVEKIRSMTPDVSGLGLRPDHSQDFVLRFEDKEWVCGWEPMNLDGLMSLEARSHTAPHAICLAALRAVGHDFSRSDGK